MIEELEVLKMVTNRLEEAGIQYMITGSVATNYYSVPRMTRDIDIVVQLKGKDVKKLYDLFEGDFYLDENAVKDAVASEGMFNVIHNETVIKVDFIVKKRSEYRELEFERRKKIDIEWTSVWIASPEDMILSKLFWAKDGNSEMQMKDVQNMMGYVEGLDVEYIEKWAKKLGLDEIYSKVEK